MTSTARISLHRPTFNSAAQYLESVRECRALGRPVWPPETRGELEALMAEFPVLAQRFIPDGKGLAALGLPANFGKAIEPFGQLFRERFVKTLEVNDEFRETILGLLFPPEAGR